MGQAWLRVAKRHLNKPKGLNAKRALHRMRDFKSVTNIATHQYGNKILASLITNYLRTWLREPDLNRRPSGYEPDELPGCSIPRQLVSNSTIPVKPIN